MLLTSQTCTCYPCMSCDAASSDTVYLLAKSIIRKHHIRQAGKHLAKETKILFLTQNGSLVLITHGLHFWLRLGLILC